MTLWTRIAQWARMHPILLLVGIVGLLLLGGAFVAFGPLDADQGVFLLAGGVMLAGLLSLSLQDRLPLEFMFLAFIAFLPATRFSLFESSFSFQANFLPLILAALLLVWRAVARHLPLLIPRSRVHTAILIFFLVIAASFFLSIQVPPGEYRGEVRYLRSAKQIMNFVFMMGAYLTILLTVASRRMFRWALWVFIGTSFVAALYGLYQFIAYPLGWPFVDLFPDTASFGESSIWAISLAGGRFLRIWSVASEPVWFGDYLVGVIPVAAMLLLSDAVSAKARRRLLVVVGVLGLALLLTFTRSAYLALLIGAVVMIIYRPSLLKPLGRVLLILVGVVALVSLIVSRLPNTEQASLVAAVTERFISPLQDENFGNIHRTTAVATSWEMFKAIPWGVGYGNYGFFFYDYRPIWGVSFTDVYVNAFPVMTGGFLLRLLTETSIPGIAAFLFLVAVIITEGVRGWRAAAAAGDKFMEAASAGLLASFITLMVRLMAADSIHFTYQWFIIAMIVLARRLPQRLSTPREVA